MESFAIDGDRERKFLQTPFRICWEHGENAAGVGQITEVNIFRQHEPCGTFYARRNYVYGPAFWPFQATNGEWFALCPGDEGCGARVLRLGERAEPWCDAEVPKSWIRFQEFFVPRYRVGTTTTTPKFKIEGGGYVPNTEPQVMRHYHFEPDDNLDWRWHNLPFGFAAGCYPQAGSLLDILHVDLSRVLEKEVAVSHRYGFIRLPDRLALEEAIRIERGSEWDWDPTEFEVYITHEQRVTGEGLESV